MRRRFPKPLDDKAFTRKIPKIDAQDKALHEIQIDAYWRGREEATMHELKRTPANCTTWELYLAQLRELIWAVKTKDYWRVIHAQRDVRQTRAHLRILS